jgi:hypothetical protein
MTEEPHDTQDSLRSVGGLLIGVGALMILLRKGADWDAFPLFLVLGLPALLLYGWGVTAARDGGEVRAWQAVYAVFGLVLVPLALDQLVEAVGGNSGTDLNTFWVFGLTAGLGLYAGIVAGIRFGLLAACIAAIISWSTLWDKLLGGDGIADHVDAYRVLLLVLAIVLISVGIALWRSAADEEDGLGRFSEMLTGAGIAAVVACGLGVASLLLTLFPIPLAGGSPVGTGNFWDVSLLVISVLLIGAGARIGLRGPVYIGTLGLTVFLIVVGFDLNGNPPHATKMGLWPWLLLIGGVGAIAASLSEGFSLGNRPRDWGRRISGR